MAWQTPVTDRIDGAWHTLADQNRIAQNLDWLATELTSHQLYNGPTVAKTSYIHNDYISTADWNDILYVLNEMVDALAIEVTGQATDARTFDNMNTVEDITLQIYNRLQLLLSQANNNHYAGDDIYPQADISIYSGGLAV